MFRRLTLAIATFVLLATAAAAQTPESTTQMQLAQSATFKARLEYLGVQIAKEVLEEVANGSGASPVTYTTTCHTLRVELARAWAQSPTQMTHVAAVWVAGTNESGAVIVGTVTNDNGIIDSSASDLALKQALRWKWSAMSRCVSNP